MKKLIESKSEKVAIIKNKNLEIIKKHLNEIPDGCESVNQCKATYEILNAAERMAEEIAYWKHQFNLEVSGRKMAERELEEIKKQYHQYRKMKNKVFNLCDFCKDNQQCNAKAESVTYDGSNVIDCMAFENLTIMQ